VSAGLLDAQAKTNSDGYDSEIFDEVTTKDGYVLSLFRITGKKRVKPVARVAKAEDFIVDDSSDAATETSIDDSESQERTYKGVVLLQHGMHMSAQEWLMYTDKENTLPYLISDLGYDVWLGSNRGTIDFSSHTTLDPIADAAEYWNFSYMEMGLYDL
jgi:hypothetical protein